MEEVCVMRKLKLAIAAAVVIVLAWAGRAITAEEGSAIFSKKCGVCHAKDGKGNPKMAERLGVPLAAVDLTDKETKDKSDQDLYNTASRGKGKMPAFGDKLTPEELSSVIAYIRALK